jgi:hypothetical protein
MFELGIRLTFDKPTVVVKDDKTDYSFDMSPVEHVTYPRDLRFNQIVQFKEKLTAKVKSTHELATNNRNYSTFLKHFGQFTVPKLDQTEVSPDQFIIERLEELTRSVTRLERSTRPSSLKLRDPQSATALVVDESLLAGYRPLIEFSVGDTDTEKIKRTVRIISSKYPETMFITGGNILGVYVRATTSEEDARLLREVVRLEIERARKEFVKSES